MRTLFNKKSNTKGFTLVEILISIAIFTVVMTLLMGGYVAINGIRKKISAKQQMLSDFRLVLDSMGRELLSGGSYSKVVVDGTGKATVTPGGCDSGCSDVQFGSTVRVDAVPRLIEYRLDNNQIKKAVQTKYISDSACSGATLDGHCFLPVSSNEIIVQDFKIYVSNYDPLSDDSSSERPIITISVKGTINIDNSNEPFEISTTADPRFLTNTFNGATGDVNAPTLQVNYITTYVKGGGSINGRYYVNPPSSDGVPFYKMSSYDISKNSSTYTNESGDKSNRYGLKTGDLFIITNDSADIDVFGTAYDSDGLPTTEDQKPPKTKDDKDVQGIITASGINFNDGTLSTISTELDSWNEGNTYTWRLGGNGYGHMTGISNAQDYFFQVVAHDTSNYSSTPQRILVLSNLAPVLPEVKPNCDVNRNNEVDINLLPDNYFSDLIGKEMIYRDGTQIATNYTNGQFYDTTSTRNSHVYMFKFIYLNNYGGVPIPPPTLQRDSNGNSIGDLSCSLSGVSVANCNSSGGNYILIQTVNYDGSQVDHNRSIHYCKDGGGGSSGSSSLTISASPNKRTFNSPGDSQNVTMSVSGYSGSVSYTLNGNGSNYFSFVDNRNGTITITYRGGSPNTVYNLNINGQGGTQSNTTQFEATISSGGSGTGGGA